MKSSSDIEFMHWLGGFFDGEGHIGHQERFSITLYQKDRRVLKMVQKKVGGLLRYTHNHGDPARCSKLCWYGYPAAILLRDLLPYLRHPRRIKKAKRMLDRYFAIDRVQFGSRWYKAPRKLRQGEEYYYAFGKVYVRKAA